MVQLCFSSGDLDKVKTYAKLSKTMFEQLHEQHHPLYKHAVLLQIFCETTVWQTFKSDLHCSIKVENN